MDPMQVLAHQTAMGYEDSLRSALPDAPRQPAGRETERVRIRLARTLRRTADHLDPAPAQPCAG